MPSGLYDSDPPSGHQTCTGTEREPLVRLIKHIEVAVDDVLFVVRIIYEE
jgi:hypothetical protein